MTQCVLPNIVRSSPVSAVSLCSPPTHTIIWITIFVMNVNDYNLHARDIHTPYHKQNIFWRACMSEKNVFGDSHFTFSPRLNDSFSLAPLSTRFRIRNITRASSWVRTNSCRILAGLWLFGEKLTSINNKHLTTLVLRRRKISIFWGLSSLLKKPRLITVLYSLLPIAELLGNKSHELLNNLNVKILKKK